MPHQLSLWNYTDYMGHVLSVVPIDKEERGRNTGPPGEGPPRLIPLNQQSWDQDPAVYPGCHSWSGVKVHQAAGRSLWA